MRKTAFEIVSAAFEALEKLKPTPQEIQDYADLNQDDYSVVTYSKSKGGDYYLLPQIARYLETKSWWTSTH